MTGKALTYNDEANGGVLIRVFVAAERSVIEGATRPVLVCTSQQAARRHPCRHESLFHQTAPGQLPAASAGSSPEDGPSHHCPSNELKEARHQTISLPG